MTRARKIGATCEWLWAEDTAADLYCADVMRELTSLFVGTRSVCTSWDSGMLEPSGMRDWQVQSGQAVSPAIDESLARNWPESSCGFDEWYFCESLPPFEKLSAICSWGVSLGDVSELPGIPTGFDLWAQLDRYQPLAVLGDGRRIFLITRHPRLFDEFTRLCDRRRTTTRG